MCIEAKIQHVLISLNQGQGSVFTIRECAQSMPRIDLPLKMIILEKTFFHQIAQKFDFSQNNSIFAFIVDFLKNFSNRSHF